MSGLAWVVFALACAAGAVTRYVVDGLIDSSDTFSTGTFVINATGSLLLGFITGLALYHGLHGAPRVVAGTGFCGAYTTFSAFSLETVRMIEQGAHRAALRYSLSTAAVCGTAAAIGMALGAL